MSKDHDDDLRRPTAPDEVDASQDADAAGSVRGDGRPQSKNTHAGNPTVNHGPDDQGPEELEEQLPGGLEGLASDELALRRMLQDAVQDIEPTDGTLEHLRRAVPARRARKRQAAVGLAAAALFIGTAIPAVLHVSNATGSDANPSIAGHGSQAQGGASEGKGKDDAGKSTAGTADQTEGQDQGGGEQDEKGGSGGGPSDSAGPSATSEVGTPLCTAAQLNGTGSANAPDAMGTVYGTFRVTNISGNGCTVDAPGTVGTLAQGAADATRISVVAHTAGDAAGSLPDPSLEVSSLLLKAGDSYEVQFAWVPSETCPTDNGGGTDGGGTGGDSGGETGGTDPSANPSPTQSTTSGAQGTSTGGDTGTSTQTVRSDGTTEGSVTVSHTAAAGAPTVSAVISNACAGTVYRTGVLPAS
ncbi:hypothetical protein [Streptomyces sp. NPDC057877]|uniref:hypothetical protein n=1 Tax=Streptomyces sp. NPDC057877 TaxID=3346269 RepID=UPI00369D4347